MILGQDDNDSQQAAEAMIQLGYYHTQQQQQQQSHEESMDFDPNYDPSDFLIQKKDSDSQEAIQPVAQPSYQENYDFPVAGIQEGAGGDEIQPNYYSGFNQPAFNVGEFAAYQQQDEFLPQQPQQQLMPDDGSVLADLEISDSDDEEQNESNENPADTSKEEDGLWF